MMRTSLTIATVAAERLMNGRLRCGSGSAVHDRSIDERGGMPCDPRSLMVLARAATQPTRNVHLVVILMQRPSRILRLWKKSVNALTSPSSS